MTLAKESNKQPLEFNDFAANISNMHKDLIQTCSYIKHSKPDVIIESSILVLGLLSYVHSKKTYVNIFTQIEKVFIYYID